VPNIGPFELLIILVLALLILGPGKLPDVGAALGKTIREFRKASSDVQESMRLDAPPPATQATATAAPAAPAEAPPAPPAAAAAPTATAAEPAAPASAEDQAGHIRMLEARLAALEKERQAERPASDR
jgi:sec-independent protein translocase protein TatA